MFNTVILTGRLTADPELKTTANGVSVTSFTIAVQRKYKQGEESQADFINIVAWRQTAEFITKYFHKGSMIGIEGSIQTRKYQDKDGNNRVAFEVIANNVQFVESKKASADASPASDSPQQLADNFASVQQYDFGDDLPF